MGGDETTSLLWCENKRKDADMGASLPERLLGARPLGGYGEGPVLRHAQSDLSQTLCRTELCKAGEGAGLVAVNSQMREAHLD